MSNQELAITKRQKIFNVLNRTEEIVLVTLLATTVILIFTQVIMRYVFNSSLSWTEELARYMFIWESWLGISLGARMGKHIRIEILINKLKGNAFIVVMTIADILTLVILGFLIYYGVELTDKVFGLMNKSSALRIPMGFVYLALPVSCTLMVVRTVTDLIVRIKGKGVEVV